MLDMFTECLLARKKSGKDKLVRLPFILAGLVATLLFLMYLAGTLLSGVGLAAVVMVWWWAYIQITNRNLEFEYTVTNGDVDIDVIKGKRKRERIASIRPKDIEMVAPVEMLGDAKYTAEVDASAHDDRYDVYFILADVKGVKTKILVNPSKKMLDILKKYKGEKVIIGEE